MALASELTQYQNEEQFTDEFLIPLMRRLGFSVVMNYHGASEFGKDVVFGEVDRFGHVVYHGIQAKFVPSISLTAGADLVNDAKQAFATPFLHPHTGAEERISTFYAMNGGSISDQAKRHFFDSLRPAFGANVRLMDGKSLVGLNKIAIGTANRAELSILTAFWVELQRNRDILTRAEDRTRKGLKTGAYERFPGMLRVCAADAMLQKAVSKDLEFTREVDAYWSICRLTNSLSDAMLGSITQARLMEILESTLNAIVETLNLIALLVERTKAKMRELNWTAEAM
ncbi:hypothetical protein [Alienimonas californiensis]|uniref:Restriction endonuclease type IV Mrr domain-containing protein n=1 Tax=Alienimonas californiensis TaxID=2527989 RepID=A0A517P654_9PLAN|nr:hypothetical protein [Alienimonas californiensis]QDT14850.1 hypothetical protein CA12_09300 [Alienimonas californiensis]